MSQRYSATPTRSDDGPVVHEDHHVGSAHQLHAVRAKDSGLPPEELHDALLHEVLGHVGVHGRQRVVQEVDVFVLREKKGGEDETRRAEGGDGMSAFAYLKRERPCRRPWRAPGGPSALRSASRRSLPLRSGPRPAEPEHNAGRNARLYVVTF